MKELQQAIVAAFTEVIEAVLPGFREVGIESLEGESREKIKKLCEEMLQATFKDDYNKIEVLISAMLVLCEVVYKIRKSYEKRLEDDDVLIALGFFGNRGVS